MKAARPTPSTTPERTRTVAFALGLLIGSASLAGCASAQAARGTARPADYVALRRTLDSLASIHRGVVGYSVRDLETGDAIARNGDEPFATASVVKVPILVTVFDLIERGTLSLDDPLTVLAIDQVPGSGVLRYLRPGTQITVEDAAWLMMTISDNTATNLLLDRIIIRRVWEKMEALELPRTKVHSKSWLRISSVAMDSSVKYGFGVSTPNEMARLLELIARGQAVSSRADSIMLHIMEHDDDGRMLRRGAAGVRVSGKTGSVSESRNDCGLFHLRHRVVICVFTRENADTTFSVDNEAHLTIARMGDAVIRAYAASERRN